MKMLTRSILIALLGIKHGVAFAQVTEIDLSAYLLEGQGEDVLAEEPDQLSLELPLPIDGAAARPEEPAGLPSVPDLLSVPASPVSPLLGLPEATDPLLSITEQLQLLEQYGAVASLMREIRVMGNDEAVLSLLSALHDDPQTLALVRDAFETLDIAPVQVLAPIPAAVFSPDTGEEGPEPEEPTPPPPPPVRHEIIPVFAQVASETGARDKVIVSIGGKRFIRLPSETIEVDGRRIVVDAINASVNATGAQVVTIWVVENGTRRALEWN